MQTVLRSNKRTKLTVRLTDEALQTVNEAVELGLCSSSNAFIDDAIRAKAREVRHARMRRLAAEAIADPQFVEDMHATAHAFEATDHAQWPLYDSAGPPT